MKPKVCCLAAVLRVAVSLVPGLQAASMVQFSASNYSVPESLGALVLNVQQFPASDAIVTVDYTTVDGTATNGIKYTAVAGTLVFSPGDTNKPIRVPILNNGVIDGTQCGGVDVPGPGSLSSLRTSEHPSNPWDSGRIPVLRRRGQCDGARISG